MCAVETEPNVLLLDLSPEKALEIIRELAKETDRIAYTKHAEDRMEARSITATQVLRCLRKGSITEGPAREPRGNWRIRMEVFSAGEPVKVVGVLDRDDQGNYFLVITVMQ